MFKKTLTYKNYNDEEITEDFYFNMSEAELTELELSQEGGMKNLLEKIVKEDNRPEIIKMFKKILLMSYGEKSSDGRRFIKSEELSTAFSQTQAYNDIFMWLMTDEDAAVQFINGIIPQGLNEE